MSREGWTMELKATEYACHTEHGFFTVRNFATSVGNVRKWQALRVYHVEPRNDDAPCATEKLAEDVTYAEAVAACERRYSELTAATQAAE